MFATDGAAGPELRRAGLGLRPTVSGEHPGLHALHLPAVPGSRVRHASLQGPAGLLQTGGICRRTARYATGNSFIIKRKNVEGRRILTDL